MDFLTAIEFSVEEPYGKAVALLDLTSKHVMVLTFLLLYICYTFSIERHFCSVLLLNLFSVFFACFCKGEGKVDGSALNHFGFYCF